MNTTDTKMAPRERPVLLQPGIGNSGSAHWQSLWEAAFGCTRRIQQDDWDHPDCGAWVRRIDDAVAACPVPPVLVAHSLGCLAAAHWCAGSALRLQALVLVAVPDLHGPNFPQEARGFADLPRTLGPAAGTVLVVASDDDPYSSPAFLDGALRGWGARRIGIGPRGHINAASGLGAWDFGWGLVRALGGGELPA